MDVDDCYALLGVDPQSDAATIRRAWLELAHRHHPDHNPGNAGSHDLFIAIKEAYSVLSDPESRRKYDLRQHAFGLLEKAQPYLKVYTESTRLGVFQEVRLHFTYLGNGTAFVKPSIPGFQLASKPYVAHNLVKSQSENLKETTLTYVLVPQRIGRLEISAASIMISGKRYTTSPISISVEPSMCFFSDRQVATSSAVKFEVFRILPAKQGRFPLGETKVNHMVWIPRGRTASLFHQLGTTLKWVCTLFIGFWLQSQFQIPFLIGSVLGNLIGGLNVRVMYHLVSVKPKWETCRKYARQQGYLGSGFQEGEGFLWPLVRSGLPSRILRSMI